MKDEITIGIKQETEYIGTAPGGLYPVYSQRLRQISRPSDWMTSRQAFRKSLKDKVEISGVPANLAVYGLKEGEPIFYLLSKQGNLLLSEYRDRVVSRLEDYGRSRCKEQVFEPSRLILPEDERSFVLKAINSATPHIKYSALMPNEDGEEAIVASKRNTPEERRLLQEAFGENPQEGEEITLLPREQIQDALRERPSDLLAMACYMNTDDDFDRFTKGDKKSYGFLAANHDLTHWSWVPG